MANQHLTNEEHKMTSNGEAESNGFEDQQRLDLNALTLEENETEANLAKTESNGVKGNEEKKIFCGGISYETSNEDLASYFGQFGKVKEVQVKYDRMTGRSRGFAFVEFDTIEACKASLAQREQVIKGKQCEIKPAKSRELGYMNKKVFVGGLPGDFPEEELRKHFSQYGKVEEIEWPFDKQSKTRKNFAFVVFEDEDSADRAAATPKQNFASRECDIKKAVPQNKRGVFRGNIGIRNSFAGNNVNIGGIRGPQMPIYPAAAAAHYAHWYYNQYGAGNWYGSATNPTWLNNTSVGNNTTQAAQAYGTWYGGAGIVGDSQHNGTV